MPAEDLRFYGTTGTAGTANGDSEPDPANWLGNFRASQTLHEYQSTLTDTQTNESRHYIVDSSRIGDGDDVHVFKWILIQTGPGALSAARVESFVSATGEFKLDRPTLGNAVSGDDYALFGRNNVWPDVTAAQAAAGDERFRCIVHRNESGGALTTVRYYLTPLNAGGFDFARMNQVINTAPFIERATDTDDIVDALGQRDAQGGPDNFAGSSGWLRTNTSATAFGQDASLGNNNQNAIWLRRTVPAGVRNRRSAAVLVIVETDTLVSGAIMSYDILGAQTGTLVKDRFGHIGGGIRHTGIVTADGALQVGRPVKLQVKVGDVGTLLVADDPVAEYDTTDSLGQAHSAYSIPLGSTPGDTGTVEMVVGAGDEVGDPT